MSCCRQGSGLPCRCACTERSEWSSACTAAASASWAASHFASSPRRVLASMARVRAHEASRWCTNAEGVWPNAAIGVAKRLVLLPNCGRSARCVPRPPSDRAKCSSFDVGVKMPVADHRSCTAIPRPSYSEARRRFHRSGDDHGCPNPPDALRCLVGAREWLVGLVCRVAPFRIGPARDCLVVVGGPVRRDSWLAHDAKRQRADKLSRGVSVADAFIE